eukprot:Sdes_comp16138_c0_seq1m5385
MPRKFLVLVDGSDNSERAVQMAANRVDRVDELADMLVVAHFYVESEQNKLPLNQRAVTIKRKFEDLCYSLKLKIDNTSKIHLQYEVSLLPVETRDKIPISLVPFISSSKADFVCLGNFGFGNKSSLDGSVISSVLKNSPTTVVVKHIKEVPSRERSAKIIMTTDGSSVSDYAIEVGTKLVQATDKVTIITLSPHRTSNDDAILERSKQICIKKKLNMSNVSLEFVLRDSSVSVGKQLCSILETQEFDIIV